MRIFYILVLITTALSLSSQTTPATYKDYFLEGSYLLMEGETDQARQNFEKAYQLDSSSANINYMLGVCYMESSQYKNKAEPYLERAVKNISSNYKSDDANEKAAAPLALYYYAKALHLSYNFDEAEKYLNMFNKYVDPSDVEYVKMVNKDLATIRIAKETINFPLNVQITNLGDSINSEYAEHSPVFSADERTLIFTTKRPSSTGGLKTADGKYYEDIVISYKDDEGRWTKPVSISSNINTIGPEASINLSPDGQTLIVFKNTPVPGNPEGDGNIYYSTFDGKDWSPLKEFATNVNSPYWESHACLSADGNVLFFSSERPGGYGGKDIYRCVKLPNGKWSLALNMGPLINTEYDEDGGFIHPDGQTFFFASNGPRSMGGYDIFFATLNDENKFTNVTNIGYPINTTDDDIFYVTSPDGKRGYFSSVQTHNYGEADIYMITMPETRETYLALFKGQIIPAEGEELPDNIVIVVTDKLSNEIIGAYRPKLVNGTFTTILPPGKEYNFSYRAGEIEEEFYNEDVYVSNELSYQEIKREVNLEPIKIVGKIRVRKTIIDLSTVVMNNSRKRKTVPSAKIVVVDEAKKQQVFTSNSKGQVDSIILLPERKYFVHAEVGDKKTETVEINTIGIKRAKSFNHIFYLEPAPPKVLSEKLMLDITVKHPKTKRPVPEANITLTDEDGEKRELVTDQKGMLKGIVLVEDMKYELMAHKESAASEAETFTTPSAKQPKRYVKTLYVAFESTVVPVAKEPGKQGTSKTQGTTSTSPRTDTNADATDWQYEFYFRYAHKIINQQDDQFTGFINRIVELSKNGEVTVTIKGGASKVPTRKKGGNRRLAAGRASRFEAMVKSHLIQKGVDMTKVKFVKSSLVGGPKYLGDAVLGRKKYEKHQFVKAKAE